MAPQRANEVLTKDMGGIISEAKEEDKEIIREFDYRSKIGKLLYLVNCTRPDLTQTTKILAQFMTDPGIKHIDAFKHAGRYIGETAHEPLRLHGPRTLEACLGLVGDANDANSPDHRRSCYAVLSFIGNVTTNAQINNEFQFSIEDKLSFFDWSSHWTETVTYSSCESEMFPISKATRIAFELRPLLAEIGFRQDWPTPIYTDSMSAKIIVEGNHPAQFKGTKHMERRMFAAQQANKLKLTTSRKVMSSGNPADVLATFKDNATFIKLRDIIMGHTFCDSSKSSEPSGRSQLKNLRKSNLSLEDSNSVGRQFLTVLTEISRQQFSGLRKFTSKSIQTHMSKENFDILIYNPKISQMKNEIFSSPKVQQYEANYKRDILAFRQTKTTPRRFQNLSKIKVEPEMEQQQTQEQTSQCAETGQNNTQVKQEVGERVVKRAKGVHQVPQTEQQIAYTTSFNRRRPFLRTHQTQNKVSSKHRRPTHHYSDGEEQQEEGDEGESSEPDYSTNSPIFSASDDCSETEAEPMLAFLARECDEPGTPPPPPVCTTPPATTPEIPPEGQGTNKKRSRSASADYDDDGMDGNHSSTWTDLATSHVDEDDNRVNNSPLELDKWLTSRLELESTTKNGKLYDNGRIHCKNINHPEFRENVFTLLHIDTVGININSRVYHERNCHQHLTYIC